MSRFLQFDNVAFSYPGMAEPLLGEWYEIARFDHSFERGYDTDKLIWVRQEI